MGSSATILTIETTHLGGVPSLVDTIYRMMESWGLAPTITWAQSVLGDVSPWQRLAITYQRRRPWISHERGSQRILLVPAMPVPFWLSYLVPHYLSGTVLSRLTPVFVCSGSAHVALPLALRRIPYALWTATLYEDEICARADAGEKWAQRVLHSPTWPLLQAQERLALRRATCILALSRYTAERIAGRVPEAADYIQIAHFPLDTTFFRPADGPRGDKARERLLLMVGRAGDARKNVHLLIQAFARVRARLPDVRLVLVGEQPGDPIRMLIKSLGLEDVVSLRGVVPREELLRLYQQAALFVLPSQQEGLGIVLLEAMACGTPVVSTRSGGPETIVRDGATGRLVPRDNPDAMARAIVDLLENPAQLEPMRRACVEFVQTYCSWQAIEPMMRQAFERVQDAIRRG